jgi:hypothetical protein
MDGQATAELAEQSEPAPRDEGAIDVFCWRMEQLLGAGYSRPVADALAADGAIDLHVACDLLAHGCAEKTAYLILV